MKRSAPPFGEAPRPNISLPFYSDFSPISEFDLFSVRLASLTPYCNGEPLSVTHKRNELDSAKLALSHLREAGFSPIFRSSIYEGLKLMGEK